MPGRSAFDADAVSQLAALKAGRVSAVELLKAALARHEQTHRTLNAVVAVDLERALERARAIDDLRAKGEDLGPLAGLPMTVKDTFDVAGLPASSGLEALRRRKPADADVVSHARRAGAVIWGKTNTPVMAGDWQTSNALFGTTNNPWDLARTPGGSSGGAAAALAAGVTALEIGSDIGGSLRIPAAYCGVFAHKPTWGLVSQHGHIPPRPGSWVERDLNVVGPMARSARDLRLLLAVLANGPLGPKAPPADLAATRIGLWLDDPLLPLDSEVRAVIEAFARELAAAGAIVEPIASPVDMNALLESYLMLLGALSGAELPPRQQRKMALLALPARLAKAWGAGPYSAATMTRASTARHSEWVAADTVRARMRHDMSQVFERFDVLLAPIAPLVAFPHDHRRFGKRRLTTADGETLPYMSLMGWIALATACRLPATAIPAGLGASGLPVGVQLIGPAGGDSKTLAIAQAIDEAVCGFTPPPLEI